MGQRVGGVEHGDVVGRTGVEVDLVDAGAGPADDDEVVGALGEGAGPDPRPEDDDGVGRGDVVRFDLQRIEPVPVAGVAGRRALVAKEVVGDERAALVAVEGDVADADGAGLVEIVAGVADL